MLEKIEALAAAPGARRSWATRLVGVPAVRVRQGDYRAICEVDEDSGRLTVLDVGHRREIYR